MLATIGPDGSKKLIDEMSDIVSTSSMALSNTPVPPLRMKRIDIEAIYSQAEKEKEGEKLKQLCAMHETQRVLHADGTKLIAKFIKPLRMVKVRRPSYKQKITQSHTISPE